MRTKSVFIEKENTEAVAVSWHTVRCTQCEASEQVLNNYKKL